VTLRQNLGLLSGVVGFQYPFFRLSYNLLLIVISQRRSCVNCGNKLQGKGELRRITSRATLATYCYRKCVKNLGPNLVGDGVLSAGFSCCPLASTKTNKIPPLCRHTINPPSHLSAISPYLLYLCVCFVARDEAVPFLVFLKHLVLPREDKDGGERGHPTRASLQATSGARCARASLTTWTFLQTLHQSTNQAPALTPRSTNERAKETQLVYLRSDRQKPRGSARWHSDLSAPPAGPGPSRSRGHL